MKALIIGSNGQLGRSLLATAPSSFEVAGYNSSMLDITNEVRIRAVVAAEDPDFILNAAAYTSVDKAESDEGTAHAVNATAVGYLASAAREAAAKFIHISTDFVFDGQSARPYLPNAPTNPLGVYGRTKLAGEQLAGPEALIVRTAWVYAPAGGNFVHVMLRLMQERHEVRVVADQVGTPTYAPNLASALWALTAKDVAGIYHFTDAGVASWYDFAIAIQEEALATGLLDRAIPVLPITSADYPTPARRPHYSVLDKQNTYELLGGPTDHWRVHLRAMIAEIVKND